MEMQPVKSSSVNQIGYDPTTGKMQIDFPSGSYVYDDVPQETYDAIINAKSIGSSIRGAVKGLSFTKLRPGD